MCPPSGARGRGAHRAGPWAAARAGAVRMRARAGKWLPARAQFFWRAARPPSGSALQPARGHIYLAQRSTVAVVASARRTPQSTPVRYTCASINCLRVRFFVPHLDRKINPNWPLIRGFVALRHMLNQLLAAGSLAQEAPLHAFSHSKTLWQFISVAELCEFGLGINSKWQSSQ
jgi:hypothetical protein